MLSSRTPRKARPGPPIIALLAISFASSTHVAAQSVPVIAPGASGHPPWRAVLRELCAPSAAPECGRVASLDPDPDPARRTESALAVADRAVREIVPLSLEAAGQESVARALRESQPLHGPSGAIVSEGQLLNAYVALLPTSARRLARGWLPDSFWTDARTSMATPEWRRRVRESNAALAPLRDTIARAAACVQGASQDLTTDATLDCAAELALDAIARGAGRDEAIRVMVATVEAVPHRPPRIDPMNDGPPEHPSRRQVLVAMEAQRTAVTRCVGPQDGTVTARMTFQGSDGHASDVVISGLFANTMVGACARVALMSASVPPFERESVSVNYPFVVFGAHPDQQPPPPVIPPLPSVAAPPPIPAPSNASLPPPSTDGSGSSPTATTGAPSAADLESVLTTLEPQLRACAPTARDPITITAVIAETGLPDRASAEGRSLPPDARDCIEAAVMNAQFPHFTGSPVTVTHRITPASRRRH